MKSFSAHRYKVCRWAGLVRLKSFTHHLVICAQFTCHTSAGAGENLKADKQKKTKQKEKKKGKKNKDKSRLRSNIVLIQGND